MLAMPIVVGVSNTTTRYVTITEVVQQLADHGMKVHRRTVLRWCTTGYVRSKRVTPVSPYRVLAEDVDRMVNQHAEQAAS